MDEEYFRFFHDKNAFCPLCKDLHTMLGFGALKWLPLAAKWPLNYARSYGRRIFSFFSREKRVLFVLQRSPYYAGIWGAQVASLGGPAVRHFRCLRQRASSVGVRMFFLQKNILFFQEYVVFRFSKDMCSQLGSGWCRGALRDAPRWRQKRQKGSKISLAPHGGQAKNVKRDI